MERAEHGKAASRLNMALRIKRLLSYSYNLIKGSGVDDGIFGTKGQSLHLVRRCPKIPD